MYRTCPSFLFITSICCLIFSLTIIAQEVPPSPASSQLSINKLKATVRDSEISPKKELNHPAVADAIGFNNLGADLTAEGRHEEAIVAFKKAVNLEPEMAATHINLSVTYERVNRLNDALHSAELGVQYAPESTRAYRQLCGVYFIQKNYVRATECYKKIDDLLPNDPDVQSQLGASMIRIGRDAEAIEILEKVVTRNPLYARAYNSIGFAYFKKKRYADAAKAFKQAVEINPDAVLYRYNLGISLALLKNKPGALSQYRALREIAPKRAQQIYRLVYRDKLVFVGPPK